MTDSGRVTRGKTTEHDHSLTDVFKRRWEEKEPASSSRVTLHFHVVTVPLTFFLPCPASFPVFVVRTVSAASEPSFMNVHKPTTQVKVILRASWPWQGLAGLSVPEARER